jgi:acyl-CoA reductase-like NAD-dependent aldehyde dehydrogenase
MSMTAQQLYDLLQDVPDTREIVIRSSAADELLDAWRAAHEDASRALTAWRARPGGEAFAAFRAAQDRANAGQDALAARALLHGRGGSTGST